MKKYSKPEIESIVEVSFAPLAVSEDYDPEEKTGDGHKPGRDVPGWRKGF